MWIELTDNETQEKAAFFFGPGGIIKIYNEDPKEYATGLYTIADDCLGEVNETPEEINSLICSKLYSK